MANNIKTKYIIVSNGRLSNAMRLKSRGEGTCATHTILKFDGRTPTIFKDESLLNHDEITIELEKPQWNERPNF